MSSKSHDMKILIKEWLEEKPSRDITLLSRLTNVPYTTVRRLWSGEGEPNCNTTLALFCVIGTKKQCYGYLSQYFPEAAKFHKREFEEHAIKVTPYSESIRPFLEDFISFMVLNLAYAKLASKDTIKSVFGSLGIEKAHALVEAGKLVWQNEELVSADGNDFFNYENKLDLLKACEHVLTVAKGKNGYPVAVIGALTDDELEKAKMLTREYCLALKEMILNSKGGKNFLALSIVFAMLENEGLT